MQSKERVYQYLKENTGGGMGIANKLDSYELSLLYELFKRSIIEENNGSASGAPESGFD